MRHHSHAAMRDPDVNVRLLPPLRLKLAPDHVALGRSRVVAEPALELIIPRWHFLSFSFSISPFPLRSTV